MFSKNFKEKVLFTIPHVSQDSRMSCSRETLEIRVFIRQLIGSDYCPKSLPRQMRITNSYNSDLTYLDALRPRNSRSTFFLSIRMIIYIFLTDRLCIAFLGWRRRRKSRRPRDVTAKGRRVRPPPVRIIHSPKNKIRNSRRTSSLGRRPCSCSAPTTLSAGTPSSSSNGHILF